MECAGNSKRHFWLPSARTVSGTGATRSGSSAELAAYRRRCGEHFGAGDVKAGESTIETYL